MIKFLLRAFGIPLAVVLGILIPYQIGMMLPFQSYERLIQLMIVTCPFAIAFCLYVVIRKMR